MDATWFQQALERAGASQADLARQLRLAPSAISRMLKGERQMKILEAVQVAAFLGVSQEEVLRHAGDNSGAGPGGADQAVRALGGGHAGAAPAQPGAGNPHAARGGGRMPPRRRRRPGGVSKTARFTASFALH